MVIQKNGQDRGTTPPALVVKLGGSLQPHLPRIVPVLLESPCPLLIVPGGGKYADAVRKSGLPDDDAHWNAVAAMDEYGQVIAAEGIDSTLHLLRPEKTSVLLPYRAMREHDPLPHTWDVTSDTISAWVAAVLSTDLLVLKSVPGVTIDGDLLETVATPVETDAVDPCFIPFVLRHQVRATIINGSKPALLGRYLRGGRVPGTTICTGAGTTF